MARLRVHNYTVSLDGFAAGPDQSLKAPMGTGTKHLHRWAFATPTFRRMFGEDIPADAPVDPAVAVDEQFAAAGDVNIGATVMGRNMFAASRGPWPENDDWKGWWGPNPPYHHPVFVLTQYPKESFAMEGGTTFHFVTDGVESALAQAFDAAGGQDVRLGGGASAVRQYLAAGLVDEAHIAVSPVILGAGERLFEDLTDLASGYEITQFVGTSAALHVVLTKSLAA